MGAPARVRRSQREPVHSGADGSLRAQRGSWVCELAPRPGARGIAAKRIGTVLNAVRLMLLDRNQKEEGMGRNIQLDKAWYGNQLSEQPPLGVGRASTRPSPLPLVLVVGGRRDVINRSSGPHNANGTGGSVTPPHP